MDSLINFKYVLNSVVFSILGLVILVVSFHAFDWITPGDMWKEIIEKHNLPLAVVVGSMAIGMSIIVGLAIHS